LRRPYRARVLFLAATLLAAVAACGGSKEPASTERPLTLDEATLMASLQYDNYQDAGAAFQVATAFTATEDTLSLQGIIDWKNHVGYAIVGAQGAEAGITEVYWNDNVVLERRPAADPLLTGIGYRGVEYFARSPEPSTRLLDRALAIVLGLASTQRDNPQLIQQKPGSAFMRTDALRGTAVNVLRYGVRNLYWVDATTNRMLRFEGNAEAGAAPTIVDIGERGAQKITLPPEDRVIAVPAVQELYDALLQSADNPAGSGTRTGS